MQNILVTGGAGFIGSNFVRYLLRTEPDAEVINLDALTYAGSLENLKELPNPDQHHFIQGDICDRELVDELLRSHHISTIVHFAAETHVDRSILDPEPFIQTNTIGTFPAGCCPKILAGGESVPTRGCALPPRLHR